MRICSAIRAITVLSTLLAFAGGCGAAQNKPPETGRPQPSAQAKPTARPDAIYVAEFGLDSGEVKEESGLLVDGGILGGGRLQRFNPMHRRESPELTAERLVSLLAESLTQDLKDYGLPARRLGPGRTFPGKGWVISGQFLEVDEGNRVRRAVVGFGSGATEMQVEVQVTDMGTHPGTPFLTLGSSTGSGNRPGAAVTLNPYVAAAKFVLAKNASERDVVHAATNIAAEIVKYMKAHGLMP